MIEKTVKEKIENDLPEEIDGFSRRIGQFDNFSIIIYSKDANYLFKYINTMDVQKHTIYDASKDLLFEVVGKNLEECLIKMKQKLELNKRVKNDFKKQLVINFYPSHKFNIIPVNLPIKLFEVHLVIDDDSDSQFFCVTTINPLFDIAIIIDTLSNLKAKVKEGTLLKLKGDDYDYSEFNLPTKVHLYSYNFFAKKDEIRALLKKRGWNVKFKDAYYFEQEANERKEKIILCEGKNFKILNNLKLEKTLFSEELNSVSIFQNIKTREKFALRDKDFLIIQEVERIKQKFPKYYILGYYCIENYLFHPDNIAELGLQGFSKSDYIVSIIEGKNKDLEQILESTEKIRHNYEELRDMNNLNPFKNANKILSNELKSDDFETFYQHYDMKSRYKKTFLNPFNLSQGKLAKTDWFKNKIQNLIKQKC